MELIDLIEKEMKFDGIWKPTKDQNNHKIFNVTLLQSVGGTAPRLFLYQEKVKLTSVINLNN